MSTVGEEREIETLMLTRLKVIQTAEAGGRRAGGGRRGGAERGVWMPGWIRIENEREEKEGGEKESKE
jgi:hypothetical protein